MEGSDPADTRRDRGRPGGFLPGPFAYVVGLTTGLIGSGSIFVYLVLIRPCSDAD